MIRVARRLVTLVAGTLAVAVAATGCGFHGIYSLPLPGAVGNGGHTYTVRVELADVLDLVPYSAVKVNFATVGHVRDIRLVGRHAEVSCQLEDSVLLPANAVARVAQTSLLGEKFVEIEPPRGEAPRGRLANGDVIPLARTDTDATVEEVLGALSLLLNGGGLAQLHTITSELNKALSGHEGAARDLLGELTTFIGSLDAQKVQITRAIDGMDHLAATVRSPESALTGALAQMPDALGILADDRSRLTTMLTSLQQLSDVAVRVINGSRDDLLANLRALQPTLAKLAEVGTIIPDTLQVIMTYPTADSVEHEYFGDYGNLALTVDLSSTSLLTTFGQGSGGGSGSPLPKPPAGPPVPSKPGVPSLPQPSAPTVPSSPSVPSAPSVPLPGVRLAGWSTGTNINGLLLGELQ